MPSDNDFFWWGGGGGWGSTPIGNFLYIYFFLQPSLSLLAPSLSDIWCDSWYQLSIYINWISAFCATLDDVQKLMDNSGISKLKTQQTNKQILHTKFPIACL